MTPRESDQDSDSWPAFSPLLHILSSRSPSSRRYKSSDPRCKGPQHSSHYRNSQALPRFPTFSHLFYTKDVQLHLACCRYPRGYLCIRSDLHRWRVSGIPMCICPRHKLILFAELLTTPRTATPEPAVNLTLTVHSLSPSVSITLLRYAPALPLTITRCRGPTLQPRTLRPPGARHEHSQRQECRRDRGRRVPDVPGKP